MNCYLVKDLLPNYIDGLVSEKTASDMREHLQNCCECQELYDNLKAPIAAAPVQADRKEINFLKKIKTKRIKSIAIVAAAIIVIFGVLAWIFAIGTPADSKDVAIRTEFQRTRDYGLTVDNFNNVYLQREWVIHFEITNGKALNAKTEYTFSEDENGTKVPTGCIITLYSVQPSKLIFECDNYTWGYSLDESSPPASDFDYTVTVRYKDTEVVYSMRDEGLFENSIQH